MATPADGDDTAGAWGERVEWLGTRRPSRARGVRAYYDGFLLAGERVLVGDTVYLLPESQEEQLLIAAIEAAYAAPGCTDDADANCAMLDVRWLERPSECAKAVRNSAGYSELFLTDNRNSVPLAAVDGKCYVKRVHSIERASELLLHELRSNGRLALSATSLPQEMLENCFFAHRKLVRKPGRNGGWHALPLATEELDELKPSNQREKPLPRSASTNAYGKRARGAQHACTTASHSQHKGSQRHKNLTTPRSDSAQAAAADNAVEAESTHTGLQSKQRLEVELHDEGRGEQNATTSSKKRRLDDFRNKDADEDDDEGVDDDEKHGKSWKKRRKIKTTKMGKVKAKSRLGQGDTNDVPDQSKLRGQKRPCPDSGAGTTNDDNGMATEKTHETDMRKSTFYEKDESNAAATDAAKVESAPLTAAVNAEQQRSQGMLSPPTEQPCDLEKQRHQHAKRSAGILAFSGECGSGGGKNSNLHQETAHKSGFGKQQHQQQQEPKHRYNEGDEDHANATYAVRAGQDEHGQNGRDGDQFMGNSPNAAAVEAIGSVGVPHKDRTKNAGARECFHAQDDQEKILHLSGNNKGGGEHAWSLSTQHESSESHPVEQPAIHANDATYDDANKQHCDCSYPLSGTKMQNMESHGELHLPEIDTSTLRRNHQHHESKPEAKKEGEEEIQPDVLVLERQQSLSLAQNVGEMEKGQVHQDSAPAGTSPQRLDKLSRREYNSQGQLWDDFNNEHADSTCMEKQDFEQANVNESLHCKSIAEHAAESEDAANGQVPAHLAERGDQVVEPWNDAELCKAWHRSSFNPSSGGKVEKQQIVDGPMGEHDKLADVRMGEGAMEQCNPTTHTQLSEHTRCGVTTNEGPAGPTEEAQTREGAAPGKTSGLRDESEQQIHPCHRCLNQESGRGIVHDKQQQEEGTKEDLLVEAGTSRRNLLESKEEVEDYDSKDSDDDADHDYYFDEEQGEIEPPPQRSEASAEQLRTHPSLAKRLSEGQTEAEREINEQEDTLNECNHQNGEALPRPIGDVVTEAEPASRDENKEEAADEHPVTGNGRPAGAKSSLVGQPKTREENAYGTGFSLEQQVGQSETQVASQAMPAAEGVRCLAESLPDGLGPVHSARDMAQRAWDGLAHCGGTKAVVIGRCGLGKTRVVNNLVREAIRSAGSASGLELGCMETETMEHAIEVRVLTEHYDVSRIRTEQLPSCTPEEVAGCTGFLLPEDVREGTCVPTEVVFGDELRAVLEYETDEAVDRILAPLRNAYRRYWRPPLHTARRARSCIGLPADADERIFEQELSFTSQDVPRAARKFLGREVSIKAVSNTNLSTRMAQVCGVLSRVTRGTRSCWGCLRRIKVEVPTGTMPLGIGSIVDLPGRMDGLTDQELGCAATCIAVTDERKLDGDVRRAMVRSGFMRSLTWEASCRTLGIIVARGGDDVCNRRWSELRSLIWDQAGTHAATDRTLSRCAVLDFNLHSLWDSHVLRPKLVGRGDEIRRGSHEARRHTDDAADAAEAIINAYRAQLGWLCSNEEANFCLQKLREAAQLAKDQADEHLGGRLGEWGEDAVQAATQKASNILYDSDVLYSLDALIDMIPKAAERSANALHGQLELRRQVTYEAKGPYFAVAQELQENGYTDTMAIELLMAHAHEPIIGVRAAMRTVPAEAEQHIRERIPEAALASAEAAKYSDSEQRPIEAAAWTTVSHIQEECTLAVRRARKAAVSAAQNAAQRIIDGHFPPPNSSRSLVVTEAHRAVVGSSAALCMQDRLDGVLGRRHAAWARAVDSRMDSCALEGGGRVFQPEEIFTCAWHLEAADHLNDSKQALADAVERLRAECPHLSGIPPRPWNETQVYYTIRALVRVFHRDERGKQRALRIFSENPSPHPAYALTGGTSAGQQGAEALHVPESISRELLVWLRRQHFLASSPSLGTNWAPPLGDNAAAARAAAAVGLASAHDASEAIRTMRQRYGSGWRGYLEAASALGALPGLPTQQYQPQQHCKSTDDQTISDNERHGTESTNLRNSCHTSEVENAVLDGILFLERECVGGSRFANYGSDLLVTTAFFLRVSEPGTKVHEMAERITRSAAMRWWREHARGGRVFCRKANGEFPGSNAYLNGEDIFFLSEGLCGLQALKQFSSAGASHSALPSNEGIAALRTTLSEQAMLLDRDAFVGYDIAAGKLPRTHSGDPDYRRISEALVTIFFLRLAEINLPPEVPEKVPTEVAHKVKPYKSEEELGVMQYKEQLYLVTHLVFTLTGWCHARLDSANMQDELGVLERGIVRMLELRDVDLVGECLQALKCLGKNEHNDSTLLDARHYLLSCHDRLTGGWDSAVPFFEKRYHATVCAIGGLLPHTYQGGSVHAESPNTKAAEEMK